MLFVKLFSAPLFKFVFLCQLPIVLLPSCVISMWMKIDLNEQLLLLCWGSTAVSVFALPWSQLFLFVLFFFWLLFPSSCPSQRVYLAVLLLFDLRFFPNFPPSLPRALSYSQDIKVIHAKDLIKGLTVPKYNHSTLCFVNSCWSSLYFLFFYFLFYFGLCFFGFDPVLFHFALFLLFSSFVCLPQSSVYLFFLFFYHASCIILLPFFLASNIPLSVFFFWLHH